MTKKTSDEDKEFYSDEEINDLAEWLEDLTLKQCFFIKDSYEAMMTHRAGEVGQAYVH